MSARPKRIALFHAGLVLGGIQRVFLNLARGFLERGLDVDLVQATPGNDFREQVPPGARLVNLDAHRVVASLPALVRYLRRERPDVMLSGAEHANVVALWGRRWAAVPTRTVISVHNSISAVTRNAPTRRGRMTPYFVRRFYPWADAIVAVSRGVAGDLQRVSRIAAERISVIYNPVIGPAMFEAARRPLEHPWFSAGEAPVILAAGRLTAAKDFADLLSAFAIVRRTLPCRVVILGDGEELANLQAQAQALGVSGDVQFAGFSSNPYAYMARAGVFVLSSAWGEGLPTVLVEAMALGTPVISTDCPEGPRELLHDGEYGILVPVRDPQALADAILAALCQPKLALPAGALRPFQVETAVDQYLGVMQIPGRPVAASGR